MDVFRFRSFSRQRQTEAPRSLGPRLLRQLMPARRMGGAQAIPITHCSIKDVGFREELNPTYELRLREPIIRWTGPPINPLPVPHFPSSSLQYPESPDSPAALPRSDTYAFPSRIKQADKADFQGISDGCNARIHGRKRIGRRHVSAGN